MQSSSPPSSSGSLERKLQRLAPGAATSRAFLLVLDGPRAGRLHLLGARDTIIGRSDDADITISDSTVSHDHARVVLKPDGYHIEDLDSRNGTRLNGATVTNRKLRKKDRIQIGSTTLVFLEETAAESTLTVALPEQQDSVQVSRAAPSAMSTPHGKIYNVGQPAAENPIVELMRKVIDVGRFLRRNIVPLIILPPIGLAIGLFSLKWMPAPEVAKAAMRLTHAQALNPVDERFGTQQRGSSVPFFDAPEANFVDPELARAALVELKIEPAPELLEMVYAGLKMERTTRATDLRGQPAPDGVFVASFTQPTKPAPVFSGVNFLTHYLDHYLLHEVDKSIRTIRSQAGFLDGELQKVETELHTVENELMEFRSKHIDTLPEGAGAVMSGKVELASQRSSLELEAERARAQIANVRSEMAQMDTVVTRRVEDVKPLQREIEEKRRQMSELRSKGFKTDHPDVRLLSTQIDTLEREVKAKMNSRITDLERTTDPRQQELSRLLNQYTGDLRVAEAAMGRVNQQLGAAAGRAAMVPEVEATIQRLDRRKESLQRMRAQLFEEHRKTLLQIDLESANVRSRYEVLNPAEFETSSDKKFLMQRLGGGFGGGLAVALVIAVALELRRLLRKHPELLNA